MTPATERRQPFEEFIGSPAVIQLPPMKGGSPIYGPGVRMVPLSLLKDLVKPSLFGSIRRLEQTYIADLCADIKLHGIKQPLTVSLDIDGKMCLHDGHHRVVCAVLLEMQELPVELERSTGVAKFNQPQTVLIDWLWSKVL